MNTAAKISFALTNSSSFKRIADFEASISHSGFYQQILSRLMEGAHHRQLFRELGDQLITLAEQAHAFRQMDVLEQASQILVSLPLPPHYEGVGRYYEALFLHRFGRGNTEQAVRLLERVAENASPRFRARAMISLAAMPCRQGDYESAVRLYSDAGRFASRMELLDPYATIHSQKMVAFMSSEEGNHRGALKLLENLFPLANSLRSVQPHVYYDYMNSLAVELCEVGRLEEAHNVSRIVLASPFAPAYPEWRETSNEIALRRRGPSRSTVAVAREARTVENVERHWMRSHRSAPVADKIHSEATNLVRLPERAHRDTVAALDSVLGEPPQPAHVVSFERFKKGKMAESANDTPMRKHTKTELNNMSTSDLLVAIMNRISNDISDEALARVLYLLDEIALEDKKGS